MFHQKLLFWSIDTLAHRHVEQWFEYCSLKCHGNLRLGYKTLEDTTHPPLQNVFKLHSLQSCHCRTWGFSLHTNTHFSQYNIFAVSASDLCKCSGWCVRRHLPDTEMVRAIQMLQDGFSQPNVAAAFGVSRSVVSRLRNRFQTTDGYVRGPGQGCARCTRTHQDRHIRQMALRRHHKPCASAFDKRPVSVSVTKLFVMVWRLHEENLRNRLPVHGPVLTG